jgi:predicted acyltransferase
MATMLFGLMAGEWLRSARPASTKFLGLVVAGALCLGIGALADHTVCPSVKRIWTPSWAVFSTGWTLWMLAGCYWLIDIRGWRAWAFPFVVVGMNSIAMYCMAQLLTGWIKNTLKTHIGQNIFDGTYGPILASVSALAVLWLVCYWMWRRRVFLRI